MVDGGSIPVVAQELSLYPPCNVPDSVVCIHRLRRHVCQSLGRPNLQQPLGRQLSEDGILGLDPAVQQMVSALSVGAGVGLGLVLPLHRGAELMSDSSMGC